MISNNYENISLTSCIYIYIQDLVHALGYGEITITFNLFIYAVCYIDPYNRAYIQQSLCKCKLFTPKKGPKQTLLFGDAYIKLEEVCKAY